MTKWKQRPLTFRVIVGPVHLAARAILTAALAVATLVPATAAEKLSAGRKIMVEGRCSVLQAGLKPRPQTCGSRLSIMNAEGPSFVITNGVHGFMFWHRNGGPSNLNGGRMPVTNLTDTENLPKAWKGSGYCRYGDLYSGRPVEIVCTADAGNGRWSLVFTTNGKTPKSSP